MKKTFVLIFIVLIFLQAPLFSQQNKHYGADFIFEKDGVLVLWAVLKGDEIESNTIYVNIVPVCPDKSEFNKYSVIESNVFSGDENTIVKYKEIKEENIVKKSYKDFLTMSQTSILFYGAEDSLKNPSMIIYYKGVPDAAPEFKDESQIFGFFEHSIAKIK